MNAYELADELENKDRLWNVDENLMLKNCAMLRQQADRIAELEKEKIRTYDNGYEDGQKFWGSLKNQCHGYSTPQIKELSDAEISEISHRYHYTYNPDYVGFARAILKKASEK